MAPELKQELVHIVNRWDVDGDLCDYAYDSIELFRKILEDVAYEEAVHHGS